MLIKKKDTMKQEIDIIGAGFAGLIASKVLENHDATIHERNKKLPDNHKALLRFRTNEVGRLVNKDFKSVIVKKDIFDGNSFVSGSIQQNNLYSHKVTGKLATDENGKLGSFGSIIDRSISDTSDSIRYICDFDLQEHLSKNANIRHNQVFKVRISADRKIPLISTIPMYSLMEMLDYENKPHFEYRSVYIRRYEIKDCNVYQTIYFTDFSTDLYRASITKNILIIESMDNKENYKKKLGDEFYDAHYDAQVKQILSYFGISNYNLGDFVSSNHQEIGKIIPIDGNVRKEFVGWATRNYNIYSLGRFATWRNIQLDDVVIDAKKIKKAIENKGYFS